MVKLKIEVINKDDSALQKLYGERKNLDGDAGMDLYFTGTQIVMSEETNLISLTRIILLSQVKDYFKLSIHY